MNPAGWLILGAFYGCAATLLLSAIRRRLEARKAEGLARAKAVADATPSFRLSAQDRRAVDAVAAHNLACAARHAFNAAAILCPDERLGLVERIPEYTREKEPDEPLRAIAASCGLIFTDVGRALTAQFGAKEGATP